MLTLAFDTATNVATTALVRDGDVLGERSSRAATVLADADELLRAAGLRPDALDRLVVGTGPGSFTGVRIGLAAARGLALALDLPVAGVSTLDALAAGAPGAVPVIDARRREVFVLVDGGPRCLAPGDLDVEAGRAYVGDGALRYRETIETAGGVVPPDGSELPRAAGPAPCGARRTGRAGGPRRAALPARPRRRTGGGLMDIRRLQLRRPDRDRGDRAQLVPDAVVALDVRRRARQAVVDLPRRLRRDERLVGYLIVSRYVDAWHVMNVAVAPAERRHGVATRLIAELFALTADDERRGYTLEVRVSNAGAIELYERLGFEARGVRRGYYTDNREDALIMWRDPAVRDSAGAA